MAADVLEVRNLGQIAHARIEFGDLTVLVGPQAAGKSLLLQTWKLGLDSGEIVSALRDAGTSLENKNELLDAYYGEGMSTAWVGKTRVSINGQPLRPEELLHARKAEGRVFFVPAHRALLMAEGWPSPFMRLKADTPAVARLFSQSLYDRFTGKQAGDLFPVERRLKQGVRTLIDDAVFHGGTVRLEKAGLQTRLQLGYGKTQLPFMTWTAGQREFTPLLLGLYRVLPERRKRKEEDIEWVIIEEPEMGLHPQALTAVMALVLDLLWRGYRVVLSTHSPVVLDVVFAIQSLRDKKQGARRLREAFGLPAGAENARFISEALNKSTRTYALEFDEELRVHSRDISSLDPGADDAATSGWGGLTGFSGRFGKAISDAVNEEGS
ncbi:AAA family ATPase [Cystobacter fuscus]|uniref:AAA family ATPase n=1 Tax=Cystobacter fuscus TaxID=43 RepID=UPI002B287017|nr:AAA family ATPase [Cystobacter fuscus]